MTSNLVKIKTQNEYTDVLNINKNIENALSIKKNVTVNLEIDKSNIFFKLTLLNNITNEIYDVDYISLIEEENNSIFLYNDKILINPGIQIRNLGYFNGKYNIKYNFNKKIIGSPDNKFLFIKEISPSRKEVSISSLYTFNINYIQNLDYKLLNKFLGFDNYDFIIINLTIKDNIIYVKLLNELPNTITEGNTLYIYEEILPSIEDSIILYTEIEENTDNLNYLRPARIDKKISNISNTYTPLQSFDDLVTQTPEVREKIIQTYFSSSVYGGIELNIDYRSFENFIKYSSALNRINNFVYKLRNIEMFESKISELSLISGSGYLAPWTGSSYISSSISSSIYNFSNKKTDEINSMDFFERYLYYESSSFESSSFGIFPSISWPKSNNYKPYTLYSVTSSQGRSWINEFTYSASIYDKNNFELLSSAVPSEIQDDILNQDYLKFINMSGHYLDILYTYNKHITSRMSRDNKINEGIPKELIQHELNHFGLNLLSGYAINDLPSFIYTTSSDSFDFTNGVYLSTKIFLEGPYRGFDSMSVGPHTLIDEYSQQYTPLVQPFGESAYIYFFTVGAFSDYISEYGCGFYYGDEQVPIIPDNVVDWIYLELRTDLNTGSYVSGQACFLKTNGTIVNINENDNIYMKGVNDGDYYLLVRHRNHLPVLSTKITLSSERTTFFDFTIEPTSSFYSGSLKRLSTGQYALFAGDSNFDGQVTSSDEVFTVVPYEGGYRFNDFNIDGVITNADRTLWSNNNRTTSSVEI